MDCAWEQVIPRLVVGDLSRLRRCSRRLRHLVSTMLRWQATSWSAMLEEAHLLVKQNGLAWWEAEVGSALPVHWHLWSRLIPRTGTELLIRLAPREITYMGNLHKNYGLTLSLLPRMSRGLRWKLCSSRDMYPLDMQRNNQWKITNIISSLMRLPGDLSVDGTHAWFLLPAHLADPVMDDFVEKGGDLAMVRNGEVTVLAHLQRRLIQPPVYVLQNVRRCTWAALR